MGDSWYTLIIGQPVGIIEGAPQVPGEIRLGVELCFQEQSIDDAPDVEEQVRTILIRLSGVNLLTELWP